MDVIRVSTDDLGETAAEHVAAAAERAIAARGEFIVAFSGGTTPAPMFDGLAASDLPWGSVHVLQVDERIAPDGDPDRNMALLRERLLEKIQIPTVNVHPMPVTLDDLDGALRAYRAMLRRVAGDPPVVDLVHLGLGSDGHVGSLFPDSPQATVEDHEVVLTNERSGRRRMTVTLPLLNRARRRLWLVSGEDKREAVERLLDADETVPAGQVRQDETLLLLDPAADPREEPEE